MLADVVDAHVIAGHRVYLRFEDGLDGELDLFPLIPFEGVFASLRDSLHASLNSESIRILARSAGQMAQTWLLKHSTNG